MDIEYWTDPRFRKMEIIKMALFFPIFGLIVYYLSLKNIGNIWLYWALLIPIGFFGIWKTIKNSKNRPSVVITNKGVTINNPLELGEIEWNEISGVRLEKILNKQIICLDLKDPSNHKKKLKKIVRKQAETSEPKLKTHVAIMEKYVSYKTDEIKARIEGKLN